MAKINWTNEAERWMKKIYEYIAEDNEAAAMKLVSSIHQKVEAL
jgi:toxin ParE1/3/4